MRSHLPPAPESVGEARHLIAELLEEAHRTDVADTVTLLASETITNAVLWARTEIGVSCEVRPDRVRVEITDQAPADPELSCHDREWSTGCGLTMVDMMAASWGVYATTTGKAVWFEIAEGEPEGPDIDLTT
jgi:anti-sigma regulatory factor (Ser/Thr protein kinase)